MKVMFLRDVFDSPVCQVYRKGEVHDIPPEKYELFKGKADDHLKVLDAPPVPEDVAPKRGRPPKDEKPEKPEE